MDSITWGSQAGANFLPEYTKSPLLVNVRESPEFEIRPGAPPRMRLRRIPLNEVPD